MSRVYIVQGRRLGMNTKTRKELANQYEHSNVGTMQLALRRIRPANNHREMIKQKEDTVVIEK